MRLLIISAIFISCNENKPANDISTGAEKTDSVIALASWNEGETKKAIIDFVNATSTEGNAGFVPLAERIAVFDNDGTLWAEQPMYFQLAFAIDEVKRMAPHHPDWKTKEPFKSLMAGDMKTVMAGGAKSMMALLAASHAGMTSEEFEQSVNNWLASTTHPKTGKRYNEMVYQPMLELLQ